ncbi:TonB-dependent receptor [Steroidobacter sp. S1-65]|uniref:TonB-dependent receptor n=1 Tax=Steroidobacter gossypii TaxID=2805490 RepID=A0ABS1X1M4_9GAMM|nr:TonB-dependent receptor [Steroidobacter gossypii]MBM0107099.1 TonB-dependent receptor [Steroidobacter gossypii]
MKMQQQGMLSVMGSLLCVSGMSNAQDARNIQDNRTLEEIVVTAEKREQNIQDVPVAVTAYTSARRDLIGVNTIEDVARITPSLSYTNNDRLSIRGFGRLTNNIGTDPSVALYSDGIFSTSMADTSTPSLFIDRTEILRGPQGTLYGRNSIGGTLNVIAKRPTKEFNGEVRGTVGDYGSWRTDALLRGPITNSVRFLIGGSKDRREQGFINNIGQGGDTADSDRWFVEAQIEADLGDRVVARLRYSKFEWQDSYGVGNTLATVISPHNNVTVTGTGTAALYYNPVFGYSEPNPSIAHPYTIDTNAPAAGTLEDQHRIHLDVTADFAGATLKLLSGYQQYTYFTSSDSDGTPRTASFNIGVPEGGSLSIDLDGPAGPLPSQSVPRPAFDALNVTPDVRTYYHERQQWQSNELNLTSSGDGDLQWILGLYQYSQKWDQPQGLAVVGDDAIVNPFGAPPNPSGAFLAVDGHLETDSYAGFGQMDWSFSDAWTFTLGLRYTKDEKKGMDMARYVARSNGTAVAVADAQGVLENAIIGLFPPGTPLAFIQTQLQAIAPMLVPAVLAETQALALDVTQSQVCGASACAPDLMQNPGGGLRRNLAGEWDAVTGTTGLQWEANDDTNVYLRYSRGYKSGGWLGSNGLTPNPYADPEYVDSYELGVKTILAGRVSLNTAVFYSDYDGFQTPLTVSLGTITASRFLNLQARVQGVELEASWSPTDRLQLLASYSYLDTEITRGCCFVDTVDSSARSPGAQPVSTLPNGDVAQSLVGNRLPLSPEHKWTVGANYTWSFAPGSLTASGMYSDIGAQQSTIWSNPIYTAPSFEIADLRLLWNDADNRYTLIGFVKNAFDEIGYGSSTADRPSPVGPRHTVSLTYPRMYGMELQYRF